ncbi:MAG: sulfurtransferase TusA family protein [Pseudomonadota bacterium]
MMDVKETIDARGLLCPLPVLKLRKRLKSVGAGELVELWADDPAAVVDVPHFCAEAGHELVSQGEDADRTIYRVRKRV